MADKVVDIRFITRQIGQAYGSGPSNTAVVSMDTLGELVRSQFLSKGWTLFDSQTLGIDKGPDGAPVVTVFLTLVKYQGWEQYVSQGGPEKEVSAPVPA